MRKYQVLQRSSSSWRESGLGEIIATGGEHDDMAAALVEADARMMVDGLSQGHDRWIVELAEYPGIDLYSNYPHGLEADPAAAEIIADARWERANADVESIQIYDWLIEAGYSEAEAQMEITIKITIEYEHGDAFYREMCQNLTDKRNGCQGGDWEGADKVKTDFESGKITPAVRAEIADFIAIGAGFRFSNGRTFSDFEAGTGGSK